MANKQIISINKIKQFLISIPLISIFLAKLYVFFNKEFKKQNYFYSTFINPGDLIFDIGACYGKKLASFLGIKANIVAVEPQKKCINFLKKAFGNKKVIFVNKAVGEREGLADFYQGDDHSYSTMSKDWMEYTDHSWNNPYKVKVVTLDKLIKKYGIPKYIKIDIEGFELQALKGLTHPVNIISIEFIRENMLKTIKCVNYLNKIGSYLYNLSTGEDYKFKFKTWKKHSEIINFFKSSRVPKWGDVYIKKESR